MEYAQFAWKWTSSPPLQPRVYRNRQNLLPSSESRVNYNASMRISAYLSPNLLNAHISKLETVTSKTAHVRQDMENGFANYIESTDHRFENAL